MKLKTIAAAMLFGCLCAGAVYAAGEVEKREGMMKQIGGSMGALAAISKGQKPFDAEAVKAAVTTISTNAKMKNMYSVYWLMSQPPIENTVWESKVSERCRASSTNLLSASPISDHPSLSNKRIQHYRATFLRHTYAAVQTISETISAMPKGNTDERATSAHTINATATTTRDTNVPLRP